MILFDKKKQGSSRSRYLSFFLFATCCCFAAFVLLYYSVCLFVFSSVSPPVFSILELASLFMYCELEKISFAAMSNSQVFVPETDATVIDEFEFRLRSSLNYQAECQVSGASDEQKKILERLREERECQNVASVDQLQTSEVPGVKLDGDVGRVGVENGIEDHMLQGKREGACKDEASVELEISRAVLIQADGVREKEEVEEENDGFRTPTSSEHKIPAIERCPPAPRKPRSELLVKRSRAYSTCCRVRIDVSDNLESLFQPFLSDPSRSVKKARKNIH